MKMRTATALLLALIMVAPSLYAGGSTEQETRDDGRVPVRIYTQYTDENETVPMDYGVAEMEAIMPEVALEIEVRARDDQQKLRTYAAAGALPDIFDATTDVIEVFRRSNNILPLNPYVEELGIERRLSPAMRDLLYHEDGNIYAIPIVGPWVALLYYNETVFEEYGVAIPTNYDELLAAVEVFSDNGVIPLSLFARENWPGVQLFDMIATRYHAGGITALDSGAAMMSDPEFAAAVDRFIELRDAGIIVPGAFSTGYDQAYAQFVEGRAAMLVNGAWALSTLYDDMGDTVDFFRGYPFADANQMDAVRWNYSGGAAPGGLAVSPYSENRDVAARYAIQLALEYAEGGTLLRGFPPVTTDAPAPEAGYNPLQQAFWDSADQIQTNTVFAWGLSNAAFKTALEDNVQKLLAETITRDEFIAAMDATIISE